MDALVVRFIPYTQCLHQSNGQLPDTESYIQVCRMNDSGERIFESGMVPSIIFVVVVWWAKYGWNCQCVGNGLRMSKG